MVYLQLFLGIGCVVIAAATAVYFSMSAPLPPHQVHSRRQRPDNDDDDDDAALNDAINFNRDRLRASRPGDKCIICLDVMASESMRTMHCGHAVHGIRCYEEYRLWRRQCPYCNQLVIRIDLPGEDCAICCEPMEEHTMEYLRCEHALHRTCLDEYRRQRYNTCPVCVRQL